MSEGPGRPPRERRVGAVWQYLHLAGVAEAPGRPRAEDAPVVPPSGEPGDASRPAPRPRLLWLPARMAGATIRWLLGRAGRGARWARRHPGRAVHVGAAVSAVTLLAYLLWRSLQLDVLVLGTDNSDGFRHTDTMMLVRYRPATGSAAVISIPRDTLVRVPGRGETKINAAYMTGFSKGREAAGSQAALAAASQVLGREIPYFVQVTYRGFERMVDLLGGIEVEILRPMHYDDWAGNLHIHFKPGVHRLGGKRALEYVRFRHDKLGDLGRIQRQQQFATALFSRMKSPENLLRLFWLVPRLQQQVATNLPSRWITLSSLLVPWLSMERVKHTTLPGRPILFNGQYVWLVDRKASADTLETLDAELGRGVVPEPPKARVEVLNGSGIPFAGARLADRLRRQKGVTVVRVENFRKRMRVLRTQVVDREGGRRAAERIAGLLGIRGSAIVTAVSRRGNVQVTVVVGRDHRSLRQREDE